MPHTIEREMLAINIATISAQSVDGISLYLKEDSGNYILYREAEVEIKEDDLNRLRSRGIQWLYIERQAREQYQTQLRQLAFSKESLSTSTRVAALSGIVREVMHETFQSNETVKICDATKALGNVVSKLICSDDFVANDLFSVLHHDYGTFTHSTNVSYYSGILAEKLGYPREEVELIVRGALLHDLGKLDLDDRILNKPDKLTEREYRVVKQHPLWGFTRLAQQQDLSFGQMMMVYQHHEKLDGSGYPVGVGSMEIHPWAKICSVADVYEALTSHRPYRAPMSIKDALSILRRGIGTAFDEEIVSCWISIIQNNLKG